MKNAKRTLAIIALFAFMLMLTLPIIGFAENVGGEDGATVTETVSTEVTATDAPEDTEPTPVPEPTPMPESANEPEDEAAENELNETAADVHETIGTTVPAAGYDWASLAGVAGATAFTLLVVQFIKAPLDKIWHVPTRVVVYLIAFATLLIAQVFTVGFTVDGFALTAVNAVIAGSAAMGAYEMTFAKADRQLRE
jgi:hypothetical protein